ncbi:hypothetical protein TSAR_003818 [Trichomalopsis sarcophagae]|uniref:Uncharacterized protein n=1 Tax=Trichomalopsis sarcophagae TaxID=543379 RepID=A0A232FFG6_9HYME|nr:hypothetical protein TSAR_003818 [Trichomalopsis sarcophagae]
MNAAIIIFAFCLAGALARGIIDNNASGVEVNDACLLEYGINPDQVYNDGSDGSEAVTALTDEQIYCVAACIYKDYGIMRPNGTIDTEKADSYFGEDDSRERDIFFAVYNACSEGRVGCKLVQCMFSELKNHWGSSTSDSKKELKPLFNRPDFIRAN